jgi:hypothetical protein
MEPTDLFDAICHLDDLVQWLKAEGYVHEAEVIEQQSSVLKNYVELRLVDPTSPQKERQ